VLKCYTGAAVLKEIKKEARSSQDKVAVLDTVTQDNYDQWKTALNVSIDVPFEWNTNDSFSQFHSNLTK
jgi:hypothetical protein